MHAQAVTPAVTIWIRVGRYIAESALLTDILNWIAGGAYALAGISALLAPALPLPALTVFAIALVAVGLTASLAATVRRFVVDGRQKSLRHQIDELTNQLGAASGEAVVATESLERLTEEIGRYLGAVLKRCAERMRWSAQERISLYLKVDDELQLVARYTRDPVLSGVSDHNRTAKLDYAHGLVGRAARTGDRQQPTAGPDPFVDEQAYRRWQRLNGLTYSGSGGPRMRSRLYDIVPCFQSPDAHDVLGVVALETVRGRWHFGHSLGEELNNPSSPDSELIREVLGLMTATTKQARDGGRA